MRNIDVKLLSYDNLNLLTQIACEVTRGANKFASTEGLLKQINNKPWSDEKILEILSLPHSKIARFTDFTFLIIGASRRFLAQLTTHHVGISIMSGSLQYSDHSKQHLDDMFVTPYELLDTEFEEGYLKEQAHAMETYNAIAEVSSNDTAGYTAPHSLRNVLLVKVNLEEMKFIANQRLCKRNTDETRYIVARMVQAIIEELGLPDEWFYPSCYSGRCKEGRYACGKPVRDKLSSFPDEHLHVDKFCIEDYISEEFPKLKNR